MKVLIAKNKTYEGPGLLKDTLKENNIDYSIVDLEKEEFPDIKNYTAIIVLGSPDSANDKTEKMKKELEKIKMAVQEKIPYFGVCLGMQALVKAGGGEVIKNYTKEIGFRGPDNDLFEINLTEEGKKDPLFENLNSDLNIFHLHGETVNLTQKMKLLAKGKYCQNQVVKVGDNAYGMQGHPELTREMFEDWVKKDSWLQKANQITLREDYEKLKEEYEKNGKQIFRNFLKIANLI